MTLIDPPKTGWGHYTWKVTKEQIKKLVEAYLLVGFSIPDALVVSESIWESKDWHTAADAVRLLIRIEKIITENPNIKIPRNFGGAKFDEWIRECLK